MYPFDAQTQPQQGGGLLGGLPGVNPNFMDSPLFHIGMGLLSVPQRSLDPGAVSWGPGIQQGMRSYQQQQFSSQAARERAARTKLAEEKVAEAKRAAREKERMALMQRENMEALVATLPLNQQMQMRALMGVDPDAAREKALNLLFPEAPKGPAAYEAWKRDNPGATYEDFLRLKASIDPSSRGTTIVNKFPEPSPTIAARALAPAEAAQMGIPPDQAQEYFVNSKGEVKLRSERGERAVEKESRQRIEEVDTVGDALERYEIAFAKTGTEMWPGKAKGELQAAHTDLLLEMKELFKLGVLSGPDMELMERMIGDPTTISANLGSIATLGGSREYYEEQLSVVRKKLDKARKRAKEMLNSSKRKIVTNKPPGGLLGGGSADITVPYDDKSDLPPGTATWVRDKNGNLVRQ